MKSTGYTLIANVILPIKAQVIRNTECCRVKEHVIFTDPASIYVDNSLPIFRMISRVDSSVTLSFQNVVDVELKEKHV